MGRVTGARAVFAATYLIAVSAALFAGFADWHYDDPFITYRYAEHLARGIGFTYNAGERVLSTTTPLFALALAGPAALGLDVPTAANLIGCISLAVGGLCLWDLGRRWALPVVAWSGLALYPTSLLLQLTIGSETPLYLALCLGAFVAFFRERYVVCALCCALAVLSRGDGVLVAAMLAIAFAARWRRDVVRRIPWGALAVFALVLLAWAVPAWLYYGQPWPSTLAAKRGQGAMAASDPFAVGALTTAWAWFGHLWPHRLIVASAVVGLPYLAWRGRAAWPLIAWTGAYFATYAALGVSSYHWYYAPLVPGLIVLVALGLTAFADGARALAAPIGRGAGQAAAMAVIALGLGVLTALQLSQSARTAASADARYAIYRAAGEWLRDHAPPGARVGALEVGIVGYYAGHTMLDFAGLIQPDLAGDMRRATTYDDLALRSAERRPPDLVVTLAGILPRFERDFVQPHCALQHRLAGSEYAFGADVSIYACRR